MNISQKLPSPNPAGKLKAENTAPGPASDTTLRTEPAGPREQFEKSDTNRFERTLPSRDKNQVAPPETDSEDDFFDSMFEVTETVTFDKPFTMDDLLNSMTQNPNGTITLSFDDDSGAKISKGDATK